MLRFIITVLTWALIFNLSFSRNLKPQEIEHCCVAKKLPEECRVNFSELNSYSLN